MAERREKRGHEERKSSSSQKSVDANCTPTSRSKSSSSTSSRSTAATKTTEIATQAIDMPLLTPATGSPHCPAGIPAPAPGTSGEQPLTNDARIDDLYRLMHCFMQKMVGDDDVEVPRDDEHRMSDSDDAEDDDPFDRFSSVTSNMAARAPVNTELHASDQYNQALVDLAASFQYEEEKGKPLGDELASILNATLRKKPIDSHVKAAVNRIKLPANVPNLTVPTTNQDVSVAMSNDGKKIDSHLSQINNLVARALVPIATFVSDIGQASVKDPKSHLSEMNNAVRLLVAAFNYINQTRKLNAKAHIKEEALGKICKWEHDVGETELFPFDVTKKIEELNKTKKLGSFKKHKDFNMYKSSKPSFRKASHQAYGSPYYKRRQSYQGQGKQPQGQSSRPFLGKSQPQGSYKNYRPRNY